MRVFFFFLVDIRAAFLQEQAYILGCGTGPQRMGDLPA